MAKHEIVEEANFLRSSLHKQIIQDNNISHTTAQTVNIELSLTHKDYCDKRQYDTSY
ncbi:MAG: hypothetical protein MJZ33_14640 [Paludibacteraceae bacterium]|nr:hypothetical protein [Paludibacteraceae bacterium]